MDNGQHYILKEGTGEKIKCDSQGNPTKNFLLYKTGHISYQDRVKVANQSQVIYIKLNYIYLFLFIRIKGLWQNFQKVYDSNPLQDT